MQTKKTPFCLHLDEKSGCDTIGRGEEAFIDHFPNRVTQPNKHWQYLDNNKNNLRLI